MAKTQSQASQDFSGRVFYLDAKNVDTDQIIPAKYLTEIDKVKMGEHCLEDAPITDRDRPKLKGAQIIMAGENFGCGSSREHAVWALEANGIKCVIAPSFARIFYNNMFNNGLLAIELDEAQINKIKSAKPDSLEIDWKNGEIEFNNEVIEFLISEHQKNLIQDGGSIGAILKIAAEVN